MIKHLDHEFIEYKTNYYDEWSIKYVSYKCKNCNGVIYYSVNQKFYFHYENFSERSKIIRKYFEINLENDKYLTCNELIIKNLLE